MEVAAHSLHLKWHSFINAVFLNSYFGIKQLLFFQKSQIDKRIDDLRNVGKTLIRSSDSLA